MKEMPTNGPIARSRIHQERDTARSRNSFSMSHRNGGLREGKKDLLQALEPGLRMMRRGLRCQLTDSAFPTNASAAQQNEPVAKARRVSDLMNRQKQGPAAGCMVSQPGRNVACLPKVQAIERLINQQRGLRRKKADGQQRP